MIQVSACIAILFGVIGKIGALFATIPTPIIGGVFYVTFGLIAAVGISNLKTVDLDSSRWARWALLFKLERVPLLEAVNLTFWPFWFTCILYSVQSTCDLWTHMIDWIPNIYVWRHFCGAVSFLTTILQSWKLWGATGKKEPLFILRVPTISMLLKILQKSVHRGSVILRRFSDPWLAERASRRHQKRVFNGKSSLHDPSLKCDFRWRRHCNDLGQHRSWWDWVGGNGME